MHATSELYAGGGDGGYLQSIIQREGEAAYAWDDGGDPQPMWACRVMSECLDTADLRVLPDVMDPEKGTLYRRVMPDHLTVRESVRWTPVGQLRNAYGGRKTEELRGFDSYITDALLRARQHIRRGCRFECTDGSIRFEYDPDMRTWFMTVDRRDGSSQTWKSGRPLDPNADLRESDGSERFERVPVEPRDGNGEPCTYAVETGCTVDEAQALGVQAGNILYDWTGGDLKGWTNLKLTFAAPFLRSHPEQCYVWQGPGGTGKSTLASDLRRHLGDQAMTLSFDLLTQPTSLSAENAMFDLTQHLLALTDDYDPRRGRFERVLPALKSLLTGLLPFAARRQGENSVEALPQAVHLVTTNYHLPIGEEYAEQRRFAFSTLDRPNVLWDEYLPFRDQHGFWPFMFASAVAWVSRHGVHCLGGAYISPDALSDDDMDAVREILDQGWTTPKRNVIVHWSAIGAKRSSTRQGSTDGRAHAAYKASQPGDPLYDVWVAAVRAVGRVEDITPRPVDPPQEALDVTTVDEWADMVSEARPRVFPCHPDTTKDHQAKSPESGMLRRYAGVGSWQKAATDPNLDLSHTFDPKWPCWGMTVDPGYVWLDLDRHESGPAGWERIQTDVAPYGSKNLPRTFMVGTPSGGIHLLYKIPKGLRLKSRANPDTQVDLRVGGGGYVVSACSHTDAGDYRPLDTPADGRIPEISGRLADWLTRNGYVEEDQPAQPPAGMPTIPTPASASGPGVFAGMGDGVQVPGTSVRISPPPMGRGATHDAWVRWCYGIAKRAAEQAWDANTVYRVYTEGLRYVPADHDRTDTIRAIRDACMKAGIPTPPIG